MHVADTVTLEKITESYEHKRIFKFIEFYLASAPLEQGEWKDYSSEVGAKARWLEGAWLHLT